MPGGIFNLRRERFFCPREERKFSFLDAGGWNTVQVKHIRSQPAEVFSDNTQTGLTSIKVKLHFDFPTMMSVNFPGMRGLGMINFLAPLFKIVSAENLHSPGQQPFVMS